MQNSKLSFSIHITQAKDRSQTSYETAANFLEKDGKFYLFFDEENEDTGDITNCRFEISADALRIRRNGPIIIEQWHLRNQKTEGYIKTPLGHLNTMIRTFQFSFIRQANGHYHLDLGYDLYTGVEKTGTYLLKMIIVKEAIGS